VDPGVDVDQVHVVALQPGEHDREGVRDLIRGAERRPRRDACAHCDDIEPDESTATMYFLPVGSAAANDMS
jgi:hypothetical protein